MLKVTIESKKEVRTIGGTEAEKWDKHCKAVVQMSQVHGFNPFESDPIKWKIKKK